MKLCGHCNRIRDESEFHIRNRKTGLRQSMCKECRKTYDHEFWQRKREDYSPKKKQRRKNLQSDYREFKKGLHCSVCDENTVECLDFHHLDPLQKDISIGEAVRRGWGIERIRREAMKCVVLCANCHRKVHAGVIILS